jgi:hypothetical protein
LFFFAPFPQDNAEKSQARYVIRDEKGNILSTISIKVAAGDEFLTADNELYVITKVNHQLASAKFLRKVYLH